MDLKHLEEVFPNEDEKEPLSDEVIVVQNDRRQEKSRRAKRKCVYKGNRRNAEQTLINIALSDESERHLGIQDALAQIEEEKEVVPEPEYICVNMNAVTDGDQHKHYTIVSERWNNNQLLLTIRGFFDIGANKHCYIAGEYPAFDAKATVLEASDCEVILYTKKAVGSTENFDLQETAKYTTVRERAWRSVLSVLDKVDYRKQLSHSQIRSQAKKVYQAHYRRFPELDKVLTDLIQSTEFEKVVLQRTLKDEALWLSRAEIGIRQRCANSGDSYTSMWMFSTLRVGARMAFKAAAAFGLAYAARKVPSGMGRAKPFLVASLVSLAALTSKVLYDSAKRTKHLILKDMYLHTKALNYGIVPCSLLTLKRSQVNMVNIPKFKCKDAKVSKRFDETLNEDISPNSVDFFGTTIPGPIAYPQQTSQNMLAALAMRMCSSDGGDLTVQNDFYKFAIKVIDKWDIFQIDPQDQDRIDFLHSKYGQKKSQRLETFIDAPHEEKDFDYELFIKNEAYVGKTSEDIKPRMIWSAPEPVIAKYSYEFYLLGKAFKQRFGFNSNVFYTSSTTPDEVGEYMASFFENKAYVVESDVSSWDGSVSETMLLVGKYFFETKVVGMQDIGELLNHITVIKGHTKSRDLKVTMSHSIRSGDLWTSLLNSIINILVTMYVYGVKDMGDMQMMVLGDDNVVGLDTPIDAELVAKKYETLGMKCVIVQRDTVDELTFCSGRAYKVAGGFRWGNLPFRTLMKLGVNHHKHHFKLFKPLLYGTCRGLLCTAGHIPIIGSILRTICKTSEEAGIKARVDNRDANPHRFQGGIVLAPDKDTYAQFSRTYDIPIDVIVELELYIEENLNIADCPYVLNDQLFVQGLEVDIEKECGDLNLDAQFDQSVMDDIFYGPWREEILKLKNSEDILDAWTTAYRYGAEEDEIAGTKSHKYLHPLFTTLSALYLPLGVGAHSLYNMYALAANAVPCNKGKKKKKRSKGSKNQANTKTDIRSLIKAGIKQGLQGVGSMGGRFLGNQVGFADAGAKLGRKAGAYMSRVIGTGDYSVDENSLITGNMPPQFRSNKRAVIVSHREFLGDITGSTSFSLTSYPINPGMDVTFPWLSALAQHFEEFKVHGLLFEFKSTSATALNSTNTALGTVIMGTQYNPLRPLFTSKQEMDNYEYSTSCRPSESMLHPIECNPPEKPLELQYVRNGSVPSGADIRFYDLGEFSIATQGMQAAATIGELWITYEVELYKPIYQPGGYGTPLWAHQRITAQDNTDILGPIIISNDGNMALTVSATSGGYDTLTLPSYVTTGTFLYVGYWKGGTTASCTLTRAWTNAADLSVWENDGLAIPRSNGSTAQYMIAGVVRVSAANAKVVFSAATLPTSGTYGDFYIAQIAEDVDLVSLMADMYAPETTDCDDFKEDDYEKISRLISKWNHKD